MLSLRPAAVTACVLFCTVSPLALGQEEVAASDGERQLDTVVVIGSQVELTSKFAGGQVARGGRTGLLGNLDFLDSPFSGTAYTSELSLNQQSESIGDVLQNDPNVRVAKGFGNFQEVYMLRGFPVYSDDITLNGVFGVLPRQFVAAEFIERVEVLRGANAFVNGAAPGGSGVGGAINLVPKRAPAGGIKRISAGIENASQLYGALDIGERFGESGDWGVRFNGVVRDGETAIENQDRSLQAFSLGTDYAGDKFRFSVDLGYQDNRLDAPRPQVRPLAAIPEEPDANVNFAQPWTYSEEQQTFLTARGEYDLNNAVTVWLGGGVRTGEESNVLANPSAAADGSLTAYRFDNSREDDVASFDTGISGRFDTGAVSHRVVMSASHVSLESKNAYAFSSFSTPFSTNLYNPVDVDAPLADFFTGGELNAPLKTEETSNLSFAVADTLGFIDDQLLITIGLRHQRIETSTFNYNTGVRQSNYKDDKTSPAIGIVYKLNSQLSMYGNYAESLQPGEIAPATSGNLPILNVGEVLEPFTGKQMEIGAKYDGGQFGATASLFQLSRPNSVVIDQVFSASGEQENTGIELSLFGEPIDGMRLLGGATYLNSELARTQGEVNEGNTPIGIPEFQTNLNAEWDVAGVTGLTIDGRVVYTGSQYTNAANTMELDSWTRLDLGTRYTLDWASKQITLRARVENVMDESYWASTGGFPGANYLILANPRTYSLSASLDF
ncbi:TonB-dependent receptor [Hirschia litorea]|uniref:TonB-dependent receptor n=1 Tax=Hirschia litorea TaxID=1199156 RepID=A0ABW2IH02_9PROT